jgi:hypothetical protein
MSDTTRQGKIVIHNNAIGGLNPKGHKIKITIDDGYKSPKPFELPYGQAVKYEPRKSVVKFKAESLTPGLGKYFQKAKWTTEFASFKTDTHYYVIESEHNFGLDWRTRWGSLGL